MRTIIEIRNKDVYGKIRIMSNRYRFRILELTNSRQMNITELSKVLHLSYTKCADYVRLLEKDNLVEKTKRNKEALIKSKVVFTDNTVKFLL